MRVRTMVLAGTSAAAVAYLFDPREGRIRRDRLRTAVDGLTRGRMVQVDRPAALPPKLAPGRSAKTEAPPEHGERIPDANPKPSSIGAVSTSAPGGAADDAATVRRVRTKLEERRDLGTDDLIVDVVNGVAYLSGDLRDRQTFGEVVDLTRDVPGVRRVQSLLHLPHSETIARILAKRSTTNEKG